MRPINVNMQPFVQPALIVRLKGFWFVVTDFLVQRDAWCVANKKNIDFFQC
jgi:hypothetical protein